MLRSRWIKAMRILFAAQDFYFLSGKPRGLQILQSGFTIFDVVNNTNDLISWIKKKSESLCRQRRITLNRVLKLSLPGLSFLFLTFIF
jgi:hypothetical protein